MVSDWLMDMKFPFWLTDVLEPDSGCRATVNVSYSRGSSPPRHCRQILYTREACKCTNNATRFNTLRWSKWQIYVVYILPFFKKRTIYYTETQTIKIKNKKSRVFCYVNFTSILKNTVAKFLTICYSKRAKQSLLQYIWSYPNCMKNTRLK